MKTWNNVRSILQQKMQSEELLGIGLTYKASSRGGTFTITPQGEISVLLFADRATLDLAVTSAANGRLLTDFGWYIPKIVVPLVAAGFIIEAVQCSDVV